MIRTLIHTCLLILPLLSFGHPDTPGSRNRTATDRTTADLTAKTGTQYIFRLDNSINKNNAVDSVFVILDKFDRSGAGIVKKVFYPAAGNEIVVEDLPAGKYYAEIFVLGVYKKHFSTVIYTAKAVKKNKINLQLDYKDVYTPGNVQMPAEDIAMFTYNRR